MADGLIVLTELQFDNFPKIKKELAKLASQVVRKTALDIEAGAKRRARVDTGAMANGIYAMTNKENQYPQAAAAAQARNPTGGILPPVEQPTDDFHAVVSAAMNYTIFNEMGTTRMSAQPMLTPAAEEARGPFTAAMQKIIEQAGQ